MKKGITFLFSIFSAGLALHACPAAAFDKATFPGLIVLHCSDNDPPQPDSEEIFSLDLSTLKGEETGRAPDRYALRWVGNGPSINLFALWSEGPTPRFQVNLDTGVVRNLDVTTAAPTYEYFRYPCHDESGLVPAPEYTGAGAAQIAAENRPSVDDAKATAKKLTPAQKKQAQAQFAQAFELFKAGEFDAAILGFKQGLDIDPSSGLANFYLGECYAHAKKDYLAKIRWQRTIDLTPGSKEALQAQARLAHR